MIASYSSSECVCFDLETAKISLRLDSAKTYSESYLAIIAQYLSFFILETYLCAICYVGKGVASSDCFLFDEICAMEICFIFSLMRLLLMFLPIFTISFSKIGSLRCFTL